MFKCQLLRRIFKQQKMTTKSSYLRGDIVTMPLTSAQVEESAALDTLNALHETLVKSYKFADEEAWQTSFDWYTVETLISSSRRYTIYHEQKLANNRVCRGFVGVGTDMKNNVDTLRIESATLVVEPGYFDSLATLFTTALRWLPWMAADKSIPSPSSQETVAQR